MKVLKIWNMETGNKEDCVQLLPRHDLNPKERSRLTKLENSLRKRIEKYQRSLDSFPKSQLLDKVNAESSELQLPLVKSKPKMPNTIDIAKPEATLPKVLTADEKSDKADESKQTKTEPSKSFMDRYFGRFWKK